MKPSIPPVLITFAFVCFALVQNTQAVSPAPDGCYPNFTTAEGCNALNFLTSGSGNSGLGWYALYSDTTGSFNTGVGGGALTLNNGDSNTAVGAAALLLNTSGSLNTAVGTDAMVHNDSGGSNTAVGAFALFNNLDTSANSAFGEDALYSHRLGSFNNAFGASALSSDQTGTSNNAFGEGALASNVSGLSNTAVGDGALATSTGDHNTALGAQAGIDQVSGSNNIYIGDAGDPGKPAESNVIAIGNISSSGSAYEEFFVGAVFGVTTVSGTTLPVLVSDGGQLGTAPSAARFKKEIKSMDKASESILELRPVKFHYKTDTKGTPQFGLVAEEVAAVNPDLVVRDKNGEIYSVRYDAVNAMLLNEFLKEHRKVERLTKDFESKLARQQKQIETLTEGLQKVSAQLEASKATPHVVNNP